MKTLSTLVAIAIIACTSTLLYADDYILWSGGVSAEERAQAPTRGTKIIFFEEGGPYLADVYVTVTSESGDELIGSNCSGPWMILNLPQGKFKITAKRQNGEEQGVRIDTDSGIKEYALMFSAG